MTEADVQERAKITERSAPLSSAAGLVSFRAVCPVHGLLDGASLTRCDCGKETYNLDDEDQRSMLKSLRLVAKARRLNVCRVVTYVVAYLVLSSRFTLTSMWTFLLTAPLGEFLAQILERIVRAVKPGPFRAVDGELL